MTKTSMHPSNLSQAVAIGVDLLSDDSKLELAKIGYVDPHSNYQTDFMGLVGEKLGIFDRSNQELLEDVRTNYADRLHFLELADPDGLVQATLRIVLAAMVEQLKMSKHA